MSQLPAVRPFKLMDTTFFDFKDMVNDLSRREREVVSYDKALAYLIALYKQTNVHIDVNLR